MSLSRQFDSQYSHCSFYDSADDQNGAETSRGRREALKPGGDHLSRYISINHFERGWIRFFEVDFQQMPTVFFCLIQRKIITEGVVVDECSIAVFYHFTCFFLYRKFRLEICQVSRDITLVIVTPP